MVVPGTSALKPMIEGALGKNSKAVVFATGGERGVLKLWRADTGDCIYEQRWVVRGRTLGQKVQQMPRVVQTYFLRSVMLPFRQGLTANKGQSASAGEDIREIHILPNAEGFMVATGDCRLLFFNPRVSCQGIMKISQLNHASMLWVGLLYTGISGWVRAGRS